MASQIVQFRLRKVLAFSFQYRFWHHSNNLIRNSCSDSAAAMLADAQHLVLTGDLIYGNPSADLQVELGSHNITVGYPGDFDLDASVSAKLVQVVTGHPTTTTLTVSPDPSNDFGPPP